MTPVRKILASVALVMGGLLVAAPPSQAQRLFRNSEPVPAPIYAAPEYGAPTFVPVAPTVHEEYVYSWGVPSSQVRRIQHGQYADVSSGATYNSGIWNGGDCGGGTKCGRCGCSLGGLGGLFKCRHRSCTSGCEPKPCGQRSCGHKCGGWKGLFRCHRACDRGCAPQPKCEKPLVEKAPCPEKPDCAPRKCRRCGCPFDGLFKCRHRGCDTGCAPAPKCEKPVVERAPCPEKPDCAPRKCGRCRDSSNCCFSLFGCRRRCHSTCDSGATWSEPAPLPSDAGAPPPEEVPGPAPAEELPPPVPQASHTTQSSVSTNVAVHHATADADCDQPVKFVSHWQHAKCLRCNGELRPLYGPKRLAAGAFRLICPKCRRYFVLTPTPTPITSTDQMGYYYARAPR